MSDYNWCHGTNCHKQETQSRIRGSGDNKVLRTRRVKVYTGRSMFPLVLVLVQYQATRKIIRGINE